MTVKKPSRKKKAKLTGRVKKARFAVAGATLKATHASARTKRRQGRRDSKGQE